MPLTYYASRYGVQCQIHYAAKKLEMLPSEKCSSVAHSADGVLINRSKEIINEVKPEILSDEKRRHNPAFNLTRVGSDPMLSPNTERKKLEHRPNSGNFSSEIKLISLKIEDNAPPKPSRVPSRKCAQRPFVFKRGRNISVEEESENISENSIKIESVSPAHQSFKRQISETRFSFLDRPSVSDDGSETSINSLMFTVPPINPPTVFDPQNFSSQLLNNQNSPLEGTVLLKVKELISVTSSKMLAHHLTWMDLEIARNSQEFDLGLGITSGLELLFLPQGQQLQKDLLER